MPADKAPPAGPAPPAPSSDHSLFEQRTRQLMFEVEERKRAEESLRESEARLRAILDNTTSVVCVKDPDGRFLFVNSRFEELFHTSGAQIGGETDHDLFPPEVADELRANDLAVLESGDTIEFEERMPLDDGVHTYITVRFPMRHADGKVYGVCGMSTDITDRKAAEIEVARKSQALEKSNQDLQQFAYVASHDLQEPLRMVTNYLQLLVRKHGGEVNEEAREFIDYAVDGAKRMNSLIRDLLEFSRVETQGKPFVETDIGEIIADSLKNLEPSIRDCGAAILEADSYPTLAVDAGQLTRLFQNLVGNALKYRDPDRPLEIDIGATAQTGRWVFSVADNGIGIEDKYRERVFNIFQRLHTRETYEGTGIGLAVAKRIVERHGGHIWIEDNEGGEGCRFLFSIPTHAGGEA